MPRPRSSLVALLALCVLAAGSAGAVQASTGHDGPTNADRAAKSQKPADDTSVQPFDFARQPSADDRYSLAGGCFVLRSALTGKLVTRADSTFTAAGATGAPLHFQAYDLGKHLLYADKQDFLAASSDPAPGGVRPVTDVAEGAIKGTSDETLTPVREPVLGAVDAAEQGSDQALAPVQAGIRGTGVTAAAKPSGAAEWVVQRAG